MRIAERHILIVDDEIVVRGLVVRVLSREGYLVEAAENGQVAQEMLAQGDYALCLIDLKMPDMDGKELYNFIGSKYPELANRVAFITGDTSSQSTLGFLKLTGRLNLAKPFVLDTLRKVVAREIKAVSH